MSSESFYQAGGRAVGCSSQDQRASRCQKEKSFEGEPRGNEGAKA
jgi:hypothetical protein